MTGQEQALLSLLTEALHGVFRRWKLIAVIYFGIVLTAIFGVFVIPPTYRAAGKILLTTDRADISTSADRGTEIVRTNQVSEGELISQIQILRSRELIDGVLAGMQPPREAEQTSEPASLLGRLLHAPVSYARTEYKRLHGLENVRTDDPFYWQSRSVLEQLQVSSQHPSSIVDVAFESTDPVWAQNFVNGLMNAYVEHHARMQKISEAQDFFNQQSELLRQKLAASEAELQKARERAGALAGHQAEVHDRLNEFSGELSRARIARVEQEQRVAYLETTLGGKGGRVATPELLELEAKRAELIGKYKPESERVRALERQIERLRAAISGYDSISAGAAGEAEGASSTGTDLVASRATLAALKGREEALARATDEYRRQAEFLDSQSFDLARLERQVKLDEDTYTSYVRSAEQSRLSNALEQSKLLRLRIIEPAALPLQAVAPRKGQILVFALFGGLILSVGLGLARDHFDASVKSSADVRRYANLETLVVLPERS